MHKRSLRFLPLAVGALAIFAALMVPAGSASAEDGPPATGKLPDDFEIPKADSQRANPREPTVDSISNGKLYYKSQCTMCHGEDGDGKGDLAVKFDMDVPSFDGLAIKRRSDGDLFYILTTGHGDMPGEGDARLPAETRWDIVNYIRTFAE